MAATKVSRSNFKAIISSSEERVAIGVYLQFGEKSLEGKKSNSICGGLLAVFLTLSRAEIFHRKTGENRSSSKVSFPACNMVSGTKNDLSTAKEFSHSRSGAVMIN